jgi:hypothetical protein
MASLKLHFLTSPSVMIFAYDTVFGERNFPAFRRARSWSAQPRVFSGED